ncbi:hypothetical protein PRZ48_007935 [Zasmidium cellare]|uniref:Uncharacterized protein n=1 Tax=Zasmidium cellare TaxID=395010 RepID=A0ABR0EE17_ZASCE|nr:hypothetical protein PRZ48_007935 [Zasmidium cellare]
MSYSWLITGASSGLGAATALAALKAGHKVVAGARNPSKASEAYSEIEQNGGTWLKLDVSAADAEPVTAKAVKEHGVNVLVNNAGYALRGALEDFSEAEIHDQMETNFFGPLRTIKGALPYFRAQKAGTIINISSTSGVTGFPGFSLYAASKFALEGASESLYGELAPFGIRVLVVQPGAFRTNFQGAGTGPALSKTYLGTTVDTILQRVIGNGGKERGDPDRAAKAIVEAVTYEGDGKATRDLLRLPLGEDALARAKAKTDDFSGNVDRVKHIAQSAVFPA